MTESRHLDPEQAVGVLRAKAARLHEKYGAGDGDAPELEEGLVDDFPSTADVALVARRAYWARIVPSKFAFAELSDLSARAQGLVGPWAAHPTGTNLVVIGPVGVGKTHAGLAAARVRALAGDEVRFLPIVELLDELRPGGPELALARLSEVDLLMIDDLGTERRTDWTDERLGALINRRWLEERPTIATSNLEPDDLRAAIGERSYSRLTGSGSITVRLTGKDRRKS